MSLRDEISKCYGELRELEYKKSDIEDLIKKIREKINKLEKREMVEKGRERENLELHEIYTLRDAVLFILCETNEDIKRAWKEKKAQISDAKINAWKNQILNDVKNSSDVEKNQYLIDAMESLLIDAQKRFGDQREDEKEYENFIDFYKKIFDNFVDFGADPSVILNIDNFIETEASAYHDPDEYDYQQNLYECFEKRLPMFNAWVKEANKTRKRAIKNAINPHLVPDLANIVRGYSNARKRSQTNFRRSR